MPRSSYSDPFDKVVACIAVLLLLAAWPLASFGADQQRLAALAGDGAVMLRSPSGEELVSLNPARSLVPASLLKIPLAQVALAALGKDFRFATQFYRNDAGDLLIRGLGDPFLVSEELAAIADTLAELGLSRIRRVVMDDSAFESNLDLPDESDSLQPYGARNSALAVNFNTVNLAWAADGRLISAEPQTPLTPLARELGAKLTPGATQRINLGDDPAIGLEQAQQLFIGFFMQAGITVSEHGFQQGSVSNDWTLFYQYLSSKTLNDNLEGLLRYSNNFIANQLFLTIGAQRSGYPATVAVARNVLQQELAALYGDEFGADPTVLLMLEGSGLDRAQRISANALMNILETFRSHAELLPEIDGVLRKSGTLTGVYNFAGYIRGLDGLYPFVILTNQATNNRSDILQHLQRLAN
jgi:D-alanyl-D-alanine carboxypeptidase/D-alanyl-D-alanine-endopeptidase (penicillin-binding protein 4)